jgi:hypothetical protein
METLPIQSLTDPWYEIYLVNLLQEHVFQLESTWPSISPSWTVEFHENSPTNKISVVLMVKHGPNSPAVTGVGFLGEVSSF